MHSASRIRASFGAVLLTLVLPAAARAQYFERSLNAVAADGACFVSDAHPTNPLSFACNESVNGLTYNFSMAAGGRVLSASVAGSGTSPGENLFANASSMWASELQFTGATPDRILFYYVLTQGTSFSSTLPDRNAQADLLFTYGSDQWLEANRIDAGVSSSATYGGAITVLANNVHRAEVAFTGNQSLFIQLNTNWMLFNSFPEVPYTMDAASTAEFRLLGIDAVDAEGNSLAAEMGCTMLGSGDCQLGVIDSPVPEPASGVLLITGLGLFVPFVRRRARNG